MRQVISSGWTLVFKLLVPPMLVTLSVFLLLLSVAFPAQLLSDALMVTLMAVGATVFFCWWGARLKRVSIDQHNLYVAGLTREISIHFANVEAVDAFHGGWPVIVRLKEKSEFGRTILFLAKWRPLLFESPHPILEQLRLLINEGQNN
jgi:hypothetical protein